MFKRIGWFVVLLAVVTVAIAAPAKNETPQQQPQKQKQLTKRTIVAAWGTMEKTDDGYVVNGADEIQFAVSTQNPANMNFVNNICSKLDGKFVEVQGFLKVSTEEKPTYKIMVPGPRLIFELIESDMGIERRWPELEEKAGEEPDGEGDLPE